MEDTPRRFSRPPLVLFSALAVLSAVSFSLPAEAAPTFSSKSSAVISIPAASPPLSALPAPAAAGDELSFAEVLAEAESGEPRKTISRRPTGTNGAPRGETPWPGPCWPTITTPDTAGGGQKESPHPLERRPSRTGAGIQERKLLRFPHPRPLLLQGPGQVASQGPRVPPSPSPEEALLRLPAEDSFPSPALLARWTENASPPQVGSPRASRPSSRPLRSAERRTGPPSPSLRTSAERSGEGQAEGAAPQARASAETRKEEIAPGC